jgi:hypothetical protein
MDRMEFIRDKMEEARNFASKGFVNSARKSVEKAQQCQESCDYPQPPKPNLTDREWEDCFSIGMDREMALARDFASKGFIDGAKKRVKNAQKCRQLCAEPKPPRPDLTDREWEDCFSFGMDRQMALARDCVSKGLIDEAKKRVENAQKCWKLCAEPKPAKPDLTTDEWRKCHENGIDYLMKRARVHILLFKIKCAQEMVEKAQQCRELCDEPKPAKPDLTTEEWMDGIGNAVNDAMRIAHECVATEAIDLACEMVEEAQQRWEFYREPRPAKPDLTIDEWRKCHRVALEAVQLYEKQYGHPPETGGILRRREIFFRLRLDKLRSQETTA